MKKLNLEKVDVSGLTFWIRPDSSDMKAIKEVVSRKGYEKKQFRLEDDTNWLDLGANIGAFSVLAGSKGCNTIAVEPEPETCAILKKNIAANGLTTKVEVIQGAAVTEGSPKNMILNVNSARRNYWRSSVEKKWRGGHEVAVKTINFMDLVRDNQACKMDIEGSEMAILEAMPSDRRIWNRLVYEWSFDIDDSIGRFLFVAEKLRRLYPHVSYPGFNEEYANWQKSWFPACRTVWCR